MLDGRWASSAADADRASSVRSGPAAHRQKPVRQLDRSSHPLPSGCGHGDSIRAIRAVRCGKRLPADWLVGEFTTNRLRGYPKPGQTDTAAPHRWSLSAPGQPEKSPRPPSRVVGRAAHRVARTGREPRWAAGENDERGRQQRPERSRSTYRPQLTGPRRRRARERYRGGSDSRLCPESSLAPAASPRTTPGGPCPS